MLVSTDGKYISGEDTEVCDTPNELVVSHETRSDNIHEEVHNLLWVLSRTLQVVRQLSVKTTTCFVDMVKADSGLHSRIGRVRK